MFATSISRRVRMEMNKSSCVGCRGHVSLSTQERRRHNMEKMRAGCPEDMHKRRSVTAGSSTSRCARATSVVSFCQLFNTRKRHNLHQNSDNVIKPTGLCCKLTSEGETHPPRSSTSQLQWPRSKLRPC